MMELTHHQKLAASVLTVFLMAGGACLWVSGQYHHGKEYRAEEDKADTMYVHLCGAVKHPGIVRFQPGMRVFQVIAKAGGAFSDADLEQVNLAAFVVDGEQIYLPRQGESHPHASQDHSSEPGGSTEIKDVNQNGKYAKALGSIAGTGSKDVRPAPKPHWPVDINRATADQLEQVPGIGPVMAERILKYRDSQGKFTSYEELLKVNGIGPGKLEKFRPYLIVP